MTKQDIINSLYEEIIYLDEIAGVLDPESNAKIDSARVALKQRILVNELLLKHDFGTTDYLCCSDIADRYGIDVDLIHAEVDHRWDTISA